MKLELLKSLGSTGMLLDYKTFIPDTIEIDVPEDGVLLVGQRTYAVSDGKVRFPEWELLQGPSKVVFSSKDGTNYSCGTINRNNRFISVSNPTDNIVVKLALCCEAQNKRIEALEDEIRIYKEQFGISII